MLLSADALALAGLPGTDAGDQEAPWDILPADPQGLIVRSDADPDNAVDLTATPETPVSVISDTSAVVSYDPAQTDEQTYHSSSSSWTHRFPITKG